MYSRNLVPKDELEFVKYKEYFNSQSINPEITPKQPAQLEKPTIEPLPFPTNPTDSLKLQKPIEPENLSNSPKKIILSELLNSEKLFNATRPKEADYLKKSLQSIINIKPNNGNRKDYPIRFHDNIGYPNEFNNINYDQLEVIQEKEKEQEKEGESIFDEQSTCENLSNISFENVNNSKMSEDANVTNETAYNNVNNNYNNTINKMFLKGLITKNNQINELWTKKLKDSGRYRNGSNM